MKNDKVAGRVSTKSNTFLSVEGRGIVEIVEVDGTFVDVPSAAPKEWYMAQDSARTETLGRPSEMRLAEAPRSLSRHLWDIEWPSWSFEGIQCEVGAFAEAIPFIATHYPSIFATEPGRFLEESMTPAKRRFLEQCDAFILREGSSIVGVSICHPTDWSTYYVRTMALLPAVRQRRFTTEWVSRMEGPLREVGVHRLEADCSPGNVAVNRLFMTAGWIVTATLNTERWGTMLHYTKYLTPVAASCFRQQFLAVPDYAKPKIAEVADSLANTPHPRRNP